MRKNGINIKRLCQNLEGWKALKGLRSQAKHRETRGSARTHGTGATTFNVRPLGSRQIDLDHIQNFDTRHRFTDVRARFAGLAERSVGGSSAARHAAADTLNRACLTTIDTRTRRHCAA
jgi:hypothetical protein